MTEKNEGEGTPLKDEPDNRARLAMYLPVGSLAEKLVDAARNGKALSDVMDERLAELRAEYEPTDSQDN